MTKNDLELLVEELEGKRIVLEAELQAHLAIRDYMGAQWVDDQLWVLQIRIRTLKNLLYQDFGKRTQLRDEIKAFEARWTREGMLENPVIQHRLQEMKEELRRLGPERKHAYLDSDHLLALLEDMANGRRKGFTLRLRQRYEIHVKCTMEAKDFVIELEFENNSDQNYRHLEQSELKVIGFDFEDHRYRMLVPSFLPINIPEIMEVLARLSFDVLHLSRKDKVELIL